jgi:hypothetical protein
MNTNRFVTMSRLLLAAGLVAASAAAQAGGGVYWSVNVDAPVQGLGNVSTAISNTRHGVYAQPAQVYYAPQQVVYTQPAVVVQPRPVYYQPAYVQPVVYAPVRRCDPRPWGWGWHHREWRQEYREPMMLPHGEHHRDRW